MPTEAELKLRIQTLEKQLADHAGKIGTLEQSRQVLQAEVDRRGEQMKTMEQERKSFQAQIEKLSADLARVQAERPRFPVESLASSFKNLLENFQAEAAKPTASGVAGTLRSVDVELKGFVEVHEDKTHLVVPKPGEAIDANLLSLLRMSFATVPTLPKPPK